VTKALEQVDRRREVQLAAQPEGMVVAGGHELEPRFRGHGYSPSTDVGLSVTP
jgi:hypothetical protein